MKKNDIYEIKIEDISNDGEGIGHIREDAEGHVVKASESDSKDTGYAKKASTKNERGLAVFVKDAIPGDVIKVRITKDKKKYAFGRLEEIIEPSPDRVQTVCKVARQCGGCSIQHMSYVSQLEYKFNKVKNCLSRIGEMDNPEAKMEYICGMFTSAEAEKLASTNHSCPIKPTICDNGCWNYRNKAQFPVGTDKNGRVVSGFYAGRTHSIIPTESCHIQSPVNDEIIKIVCDFMNEYKISTYDEEKGKGLVRHILTRVGYTTGELMVCLIVNGNKLPHSDVLIKRLSKLEGMTSICLNINTEKTNRILGDRCVTLWGQDYITDYIGNVKYQISPMSFYQVNPVQTTKLYEKALEYADLKGDETVWDLYCGIGTISLFLAQKAKKVYGVEIVPQAIDDAKKNAALNGFDNTEFFVGKAEEILPEQYEKQGIYADVIVVDPPRKGCDEQLLMTIKRMSPKRMVYVSCDPATLARDLKYMTAQGYEVEKVAVYDQFCHSTHVETVVLMSKVE